MKIIALFLCLSALAACRLEEPCRPSTLLLEIECEADLRVPDELEVTMRSGGDERVFQLPSRGCAAKTRLEVAMPTYAAGAEITADVRARAANVVVGRAVETRVLSGGCTAWLVQLRGSEQSPTDASAPDGASPKDGAAPKDASASSDGQAIDVSPAADAPVSADSFVAVAIDASAPDVPVVPACGAGTHRCGNACVANTSIQHCGSMSCSPCEAPTGGTATCDGSKCGAACPAGQQLCGSACQPEGKACNGMCAAGKHGCDGYCVSSADVNSCGSRCAPCPVPTNGRATCAADACGFTCEATHTRCGDKCIPKGQCCTDPDCANGVCTNGVCGCSASMRTCPSGTCVAKTGGCCTASECSIANGAGQCTAGACVYTCAAGYADCDRSSPDCDSALTSNASCGGCGLSCTAGACAAGRCEVEYGFHTLILERWTHRSSIRLFVYKIVLPRPSILKRFGAVLQVAGTDLVFALYDTGANGAPDKLRAKARLANAPSSGQIFTPAESEATLPAGTYWIGATASGIAELYKANATTEAWGMQVGSSSELPTEVFTGGSNLSGSVTTPAIFVIVSELPSGP